MLFPSECFLQIHKPGLGFESVLKNGELFNSAGIIVGVS